MCATFSDNTTSLPDNKFHFSPAAYAALNALRDSADVRKLYNALAGDIESEEQQLLSLHLMQTWLTAPLSTPLPDDRDALEHYLAEAKEALKQAASTLCQSDDETRSHVLKQRALLSMLAGCWLDRVSQPATEPAGVVNLLNAQHFMLKGLDDINQSQQQQRQRRFAELGVAVPFVGVPGALAQLQSHDLTLWQATFWLALSRLPASYLPEVAGVHFAYYSLNFDDALLEIPPLLAESQCATLLDGWINACDASASGQDDLKRFYRAACLATELERQHADMLRGQQQQLANRTRDDRMAEVVARHFPFAGKQHQQIALEKKPLSQWSVDDRAAMTEFLTAFKRSPYLRQKSSQPSGCRFMQAIRFGGSMFGIFDRREANIMADWIDEMQQHERDITLSEPLQAGNPQADFWRDRCRETRIDTQLCLETPSLPDERTLFYRLVNIEHYANHLTIIKQQVSATLQQATALFSTGQQGRYTDASYFDYSPAALRARTEAIYWQKLVNPFQRLTHIPDRESVIFNQKLMALGSMIDGAWAHRFGNTLRCHRRSDAMMLAIYADEMGRGEVDKNHITLILQVLNSMGIVLPHIRDPEFCHQQELPDIYAFSLHQLGMSLFPDSFYEELLGYNLGIEMLGLGEMRMHEIQKLRRYGFDTGYEEAHLTIDNFSAGHARQSVELIVAYMEDLAPNTSADERQQRWQRIWQGYASFAWFLETELKNNLSAVTETPGEVLI
ncbi:iron-containing redox enzyme family protein [Serratia sp. NPDC078593]|uniref:iron-containing redox enzyme family protein n=1 Tax=unclassified Serratia (in: enterobacteria) TaxID=2647522 RepID=UPI0037D91E0B